MSSSGPDDPAISMVYDPDTNTYRTTHDGASLYDLVTTVCVALEHVAGREANELSHSLYDVIDPDGLARLFRPTPSSSRDTGALVFMIDGFEVIVWADGRICITPPQTHDT